MHEALSQDVTGGAGEAESLLSNLHAKGCIVSTDNGRLEARPASLLTNAEKDALRRNRGVLLGTSLLKRHQRQERQKRHNGTTEETPKANRPLTEAEEASFIRAIKQSCAEEWGCRLSEVRVWSPRG